ncbi:putative transcription factor C2H2 family [Dioscorea sansibarensis]
MSEMNHIQIWDYQIPDSHANSENVTLLLPSNNIETSDDVNSITLLNGGLRLNDHIPSSSASADCSGFMATPATSHVPPMHPLSVGSSSQLPPNYAHYGNSYHVGFIAEDNNSVVNTHADNRRAGFKRKGPATAMAFDEGNSSGYYSGGSSSSFPIPSDHLSSNSVPAPPQTAPWNPMHRAPGYRNNTLPVTEEAPQRNVRRRYSHAPHHEVPVNTSSHNSYTTGNVSGLQVAGQSSQTPAPVVFQRRIFSAGNGFPNVIVETNGAYQPDASRNRNPRAPIPIHFVPPGQVTLPDRSGHDPRILSSSSYPTMTFMATLEERLRSGRESVVPPRNSRPLSISGHSVERNGRGRNLQERFRSSTDEANVRNRLISEGAVMMDRFYDSWRLLDQHRDMRLDIDNMSYEELLALEESIGNVSTGLSDETISKYLRHTIYCSPDQIPDNQQEERCAICLEEYEDRANLGVLNCRHEFHFSCIKHWLQIKNACPICKASATDTRKDKQKIHL